MVGRFLEISIDVLVRHNQQNNTMNYLGLTYAYSI